MNASPKHEPEDIAPSVAVSPVPGMSASLSQSPRSTLRRDIISGYVLTISRIAAWAGVSAIVFRRQGPEAFAILALIRATMTLIGYTSLGIGPAMVQSLAESSRLVSKFASARRPLIQAAIGPRVLEYAAIDKPVELTEFQQTYATGALLARLFCVVAVCATGAYALGFGSLYSIQGSFYIDSGFAVLAFGTGLAARVVAEPASAALQVRGRLALDNALLAAGELLWLILVVLLPNSDLVRIGSWWLCAAVAQTCCRFIAALWVTESVEQPRGFSWPIAKRLLAFGLSFTAAQIADFLYAPTDYILINRLLRPRDLVAYAPLVQIDSALLLLVSGLALALFPHASLAHAAGDRARLKRLYLLATLFSAGALLIAGLLTWLLSPTIFRIWLGEDLPLAREILPLVLIHTILGGSSAVGRAILLGMGRVKAFTASVLIAGVANVGLSAVFATMFGLKGIVLGTIVVVVVRCGIWMPWYVMRALRTETVVNAAPLDVDDVGSHAGV